MRLRVVDGHFDLAIQLHRFHGGGVVESGKPTNPYGEFQATDKDPGGSIGERGCAPSEVPCVLRVEVSPPTRGSGFGEERLGGSSQWQGVAVWQRTFAAISLGGARLKGSTVNDESREMDVPPLLFASVRSIDVRSLLAFRLDGFASRGA